MKFVIDIESNNLLNKALDYSSLPYKLKPEFKIWCIVVTNKDTKESVSFYKDSLTRDNLCIALKDCTELIGHNIIGYDLPILYLYGLLDYTVGYPDQSSKVFGKDTLITDTLLWSKLLEPDRFLGHSLKAWGKRLGNAKTEFDDWSQFSQEQLDYCIQDTKVNCDVYDALVLEKATADWDRAYSMEAKLADLTLKQELLGFDFNMDLAKKTLEELDSLMLVTANKVNPILPPKKLTKGKIQEFTMPKLKFKKDGTLSSVFQKWITKHEAKFVLDSLDNNDYLLYKGKKFYIKDELPLETTEVATVDDVDVVKGYLLSLGWVPSEIKERNLTVNTDKTKRDYKAIVKAIDAYVEQTKESVFMKLRLDALNVDLRSLRQFLINKIDNSKPIYVPTTPMLRVGVEKELCPNLIRLGDKAEVARIVAEYYTYRHRRNSIAGGTLDEDGEPITGYMSQVREDGRIATPADTLGANTGRYKHKGVCNVPRTTSLFGEKMRSLFGSGRGLHQLGYDFASLEARIMGHYVLPYDGEELAVSLLANKPYDCHCFSEDTEIYTRCYVKDLGYRMKWKLFTDLTDDDEVMQVTGYANTEWVKPEEIIIQNVKSQIMYWCPVTGMLYTPEHRVITYAFDTREFIVTLAKDMLDKVPKGYYLGMSAEAVFGMPEALLEFKSYTGNVVCVTVPSGMIAVRRRGCAIISGNSINAKKLGIDRGSAKSFSYACLPMDTEVLAVGRDGLVCPMPFEELEVGMPVFTYNISKLKYESNPIEALHYFKDKEVWEYIIETGNYLDNYISFRCTEDHRWLACKTEGSELEYVYAKDLESCHSMWLKYYNSGSGMVNIKSIKAKNLGVQDTFCITTKNSNFGILQDGQFLLTGNCIYGAQPKKLAKMLGITESKAKELFNAYWEAVLPLKQLKLQLEKAWEARGKKFIKGIDGRLLHTRSKHSLINVLFQSGGAISVKWSLVRLAQYLEELDMLGNPFENTKQEMKVWFLIAYHDEAQLALNPKLIDVKLYGTEAEAKASLVEGSSAIGHSSKGYYVAYKTQVVECIEKSIKKAQEELNLRVELGFEWIVGKNWGQCH